MRETRHVVPGLFVLAGCAGASPGEPTSGSLRGVTAALPTSIVQAPSASASAAIMTARPPALEVVSHAQSRDLDGEFEIAPCDFARLYRGKVGETRISLLMARDAQGALTARAHEDNAVRGAELHGSVVQLAFSLAAAKGVTYRGQCNPVDGSLQGVVSRPGDKEAPLLLTPRPASWPGLYSSTRFVRANAIDDPACKGASLPDSNTIVTAAGGEDITCLPTNPSARKSILDEEPGLGCFVQASTYAVFGFPDQALQAKINKVLAGGFFETFRRGMRCSTPQSKSETVGIVDANARFLTFEREQSFGRGIIRHPVTGADAAETIDLTTGERIAASDLISDRAALAVAASECAPLYRDALKSLRGASDASQESALSAAPVGCGEEPRILWGCAERLEPNLVVTGRGIVVATDPFANPYGSIPYGGAGPLLTWELLKREGLLGHDARAERLSQATAAAGPDEPICMRAISREGTIAWRRR